MLKALHRIAFVSLLAMIALGSYYCANPRAPSGGPQDIYPPIVLRTNPQNYSSNFRGNRIQLYFDEFVKLNDVANQVFISPPQYEMPEFIARGKSVIIELKDELLENTTYSIFLGESIVDITENNPLENYSFIFSTGDKIDSLAIVGEVRNAFNLEPEPEVLVMLYQERYDTIPADSAPYLVRPVYVSRTYDDGKFALISLKEANYQLFALKDLNNNFLFDQPGEQIAFLDSLVMPFFPSRAATTDTIAADTLEGADSIPRPDSLLLADTLALPDSLLTDSLMEEDSDPYYYLMLFQEIDSTQRLLDAELNKDRLLKFVYRYPPVDPSVEFIGMDIDKDSIIDEWSKKRDTLSRWLLYVPDDSAIFRVMDDTLVLDTVELPLKKTERQGLFGRKEEQAPESLKFKNNIKGGKLDYPAPLKLIFSYPLLEWDFSKTWLITPRDTISPEVRLQDSIIRRQVEFIYDWKENTNYILIIQDSVMTDIIGRKNDSTTLSFTTTSIEDYGALIIDIELPADSLPYIIQLIDDKENIVEQRVLLESSILEFSFLKPQKYKLKAIRDSNRNGRWDTGIFIQGVQPEQVYYFEKISDVRPNWELEEIWLIIE
jgi:hypothetical protein